MTVPFIFHSAMTTAAVAAAAVTFTVMIVMIAFYIGVKPQVVCKEIFHSGIGITETAAVEADAGLGQRHLRTAADAAAEQDIYL